MKNERKKIQEPFDPKKTPNPAQRKEPEGRANKDESPDQSKGKSSDNPGESGSKPADKQHLLNEDADINDETTV